MLSGWCLSAKAHFFGCWTYPAMHRASIRSAFLAGRVSFFGDAGESGLTLRQNGHSPTARSARRERQAGIRGQVGRGHSRAAGEAEAALQTGDAGAEAPELVARGGRLGGHSSRSSTTRNVLPDPAQPFANVLEEQRRDRRRSHARERRAGFDDNADLGAVKVAVSVSRSRPARCAPACGARSVTVWATFR